MSKISEKVEKIRTENNISVLKLAKAIGMSHTGYTKMIEKGSISVETLEKICNFFEVDIESFFGSNENKVEYKQTNNDSILLIEKDKRIEELTTTLEKSNSMIEFFQNLVLSKLDRLERYNFGVSEGGGLGKVNDVLGVVSGRLFV